MTGKEALDEEFVELREIYAFLRSQARPIAEDLLQGIRAVALVGVYMLLTIAFFIGLATMTYFLVLPHAPQAAPLILSVIILVTISTLIIDVHIFRSYFTLKTKYAKLIEIDERLRRRDRVSKA